MPGGNLRPSVGNCHNPTHIHTYITWANLISPWWDSNPCHQSLHWWEPKVLPLDHRGKLSHGEGSVVRSVSVVRVGTCLVVRKTLTYTFPITIPLKWLWICIITKSFSLSPSIRSYVCPVMVFIKNDTRWRSLVHWESSILIYMDAWLSSLYARDLSHPHTEVVQLVRELMWDLLQWIR